MPSQEFFEERSKPQKGGDRLVFPNDLHDIGNFIAFGIHKYRFNAKDSLEEENAIKTIFLPLPANLGTNYSQGLNAEGIGPGGMVGAGIGASARGPNTIQSLMDKAAGISKEDIRATLLPYLVQGAEEGAATAVGAILSGIPGALAGAAAGQAVKGALAGGGLARNPHLAVLYDGPELRNHTFNYKFVPKNEQESALLKELIYDFKYHSSPGYVNQNSHFFDYPELFEISFKFEDFLFDIAPSFLKNIEVNYHGEGVPQYHDIGSTKTPVSVTISLMFQEATIQTKETIKKNNR